jgi:hypothetical protein
MEDFTLPSVGGSLKKWVHCAPILPKALAPFPKLPKKKLKKKFKNKKIQKNWNSLQRVRRRPAAGR